MADDSLLGGGTASRPLKFLITGASGLIGSEVVRHMRRRAEEGDLEITAGVYDRSRKKDRRHIWESAHQTVFLDYDDISPRTLAPYDAIFLVPSTSKERTRHVFNVCTAYKERQAEKFIVLCSASPLTGYDAEFAKGFRAIEEIVKASTIPYAFLQCGFLFQNLFHHAEQLQEVHELRMPLGKGEFAPIHASDVGRAAAKVLAQPRHYAGHEFNLVGQPLMTGRDIADIATQAFNYPVTYKDVPVTYYRSFLIDRGVSEFAAELLCELCEMIRNNALSKRGSTMSTTVCNLLDNKVTPLKAFFDENKEAFGEIHGNAGYYQSKPDDAREQGIAGGDLRVGKADGREGPFIGTTMLELGQVRDSRGQFPRTLGEATGAGGPSMISARRRSFEVPEEIKRHLDRIYIVIRDISNEQRVLVRNFEERIKRELQEPEELLETSKPIRIDSLSRRTHRRKDSGISPGEGEVFGERYGRRESAPRKSENRWSKTAFVRDLQLDRLPSTRLSREKGQLKPGRNDTILHRISTVIFGFTVKEKHSRMERNRAYESGQGEPETWTRGRSNRHAATGRDEEFAELNESSKTPRPSSRGEESGLRRKYSLDDSDESRRVNPQGVLAQEEIWFCSRCRQFARE